MSQLNKIWCVFLGAQLLGLSKPASVKRGFMAHILRQVEDHGDRQLRFARFDRLLGDPNWKLVKELSALDVHHMMKRYASKRNISMNKSNMDMGTLTLPGRFFSGVRVRGLRVI